MTLNAVDISSWQHPNGGAINFDDVAASGYHGVLIKCTQGVNYVNPFFAADVEAAHKAGMIVGAYHFAEPGVSDANTQAAFYHEHTAGIELELGSWLDLEEMGNLLIHDLQAWAEAWIAALNTPQIKAGVYMNLDYANQLAQLAQSQRLWLANPSDLPNAYQPLIIQTGTGTVGGIVGAVDIDSIVNARAINPPDGGGVVIAPPPPPPEPEPTQADTPTLNQGTQGDAVKALQEALNTHGAALAVDGVFGPSTHEAVIGFQEANGLAPDGIVGPLTWAGLHNPTDKPVDAVPGSEPQIGPGSEGPAVTLLQRLLNETGHAIAVDGIFGPNTHSAVIAFQLAKDLGADGIVGPKTWAALRSAT